LGGLILNPPEAPLRKLGPPRGVRFSYIGAVRRATADLVDVQALSEGCDRFALTLVRPGSRTHARWEASWLRNDVWGTTEASGARIALERAERALDRTVDP
jgi:hypothetical protein